MNDDGPDDAGEGEEEEIEVNDDGQYKAYGHSTSGRFTRSGRNLVRCLFLFIQNRHMTKETPIEEGSLVRCLYNSSSTSRIFGWVRRHTLKEGDGEKTVPTPHPPLTHVRCLSVGWSFSHTFILPTLVALGFTPVSK